eukprot:NODE_2393_length_2221_cov_4.724451.p1 GENE.NODE_2393_length_2221_cov_4.724451~~NODE_2393_length_2221_cov_4.724451.p1  ORF type:complete len:508 (-),score=98.72 NODE_2393_length_2221_cov_4.724451:270-1793(-)
MHLQQMQMQMQMQAEMQRQQQPQGQHHFLQQPSAHWGQQPPSVWPSAGAEPMPPWAAEGQLAGRSLDAPVPQYRQGVPPPAETEPALLKRLTMLKHEAQQGQQPCATASMGPLPAPEPAFAVLPSDRGPVLAPAEIAVAMLRADWALFLELAAYATSDLGAGRVAHGIEEVTEAEAQGVIAVLFVPVACGHGGEAAVSRVAAAGDRGYIVGTRHELFEDINQWGAVALLHRPLQRKLREDDAPSAKRQRCEANDSTKAAGSAVSQRNAEGELGEAALQLQKETDAADISFATVSHVMAEAESVAAAGDAGAAGKSDNGRGGSFDIGDFIASQRPAAPVGSRALTPEVSERTLRNALKALGSAESLIDKGAIPRVARSLRDQHFLALGATRAFELFVEVFNTARGVAHRKAIVYVAHELLAARRGSNDGSDAASSTWRTMRAGGRRASCLKSLLLPIGPTVRSFSEDERESYCRLLGKWEKLEALPDAGLKELEKAWGVAQAADAVVN